MLGPLGLHGDVLDERAAERDVEDLDPAAHAEDGQAAVERALGELELEGVAERLGRREVLGRLLPVARGVDVAAAAEEDPVAGVQRVLEVPVDAREREADAAGERDRPLVADPGVVAEVVQAQREADDRLLRSLLMPSTFISRVALESAQPSEGGEWQHDKVTDSGDERQRGRGVVEEWRNAAYNCFSSGHKFCREVCPVMQVTRDERHTPTAFHANVVAMDEGHLTIEDVAEDYVHCTMCGACELRCPNTLFTGDFYRFRQRTIDVVRAMRTLAVEEGIHQENWKHWAELTDRWGNEPVLGWRTETSGNKVRAWAAGLDLPTGGETVLFADCEAAFYRPSVPRAVALLLGAAGVEFGLMSQQWCCGGPMWETGYVEIAHKMAEHNMIDWRKTGTTRVICLDPHDYITMIEHYPTLDENFDEFEIVLGVDLVAELIREGKIELTTPIERTVTYHDPCRLNKRLGKWQSPREILRAIPGLTFVDVDHVTQWSYCSGAGSNLATEKPELTAEISRRRIEKAAALDGVDTLVSACPWSERPLTEQGKAQGIEVFDIFELVAEAAGFEV